MSNLAKSIRAKLLHLSKKENVSYQLMLVRYFQERFLYRLSLSDYKDVFFLKGGVLLYLLNEQRSRPTMDIDFLAAKINSETSNLQGIFATICKIGYYDDAVIFDPLSVDTNEIIRNGNYNGIRVYVTGNLDTIQQRIQIDIGFGDKIYPKPVMVKYPVILEMAQPEINAYSIYSAIAEKFEAMIQLSEVNSRMKDFYDVFILLSNNEIDKSELEIAINLTFETRGTVISNNHSIFQEHFFKSPDRLNQWNSFKRKAKITNTLEFDRVLKMIKIELEPIYNRIKRP